MRFKDLRPATKHNLRLHLLPKRPLEPPRVPSRGWEQFLCSDQAEVSEGIKDNGKKTSSVT